MKIRNFCKKPGMIIFTLFILGGLTLYIFSDPFTKPMPVRKEFTSLFSYMLDYTDKFEMFPVQADSLSGVIFFETESLGYTSLLTVSVSEEDSIIVFCSVFPAEITKSALPKLAEYLLKMNSRYIFGNFQIRYRPPENLLEFRNSINGTMINLRDSTIYHEILYTVNCMEEVIPEILLETGTSLADSTNCTRPEKS